MELFDILMRWLPLMLLFLVVALFARSKRLGYQRTMSDHLDEVRRTNQFLERIAVALEKRDRI